MDSIRQFSHATFDLKGIAAKGCQSPAKGGRDANDGKAYPDATCVQAPRPKRLDHEREHEVASSADQADRATENDGPLDAGRLDSSQQ